jgi:hypothetical protein
MQIQYKKHKINAKNRTDVMNSVSEKNKQIWNEDGSNANYR